MELIKSVKVPAEQKADPELPGSLSEKPRERKSTLLRIGLSDFYVGLCFDAYEKAKISAGRLSEMLLINEQELPSLAALYSRSLSYGD